MMNEVFKAMADATRREILRLLREHGELTAGQLADYFPTGKSTLSHHFNVLKMANLVSTRRAGQQIYYALNTTVMQDAMELLVRLLGVNRPDSEAKS
ncbi:autorepressor SdpR family transcription factor [Tuwongella immobilis]|uniref:HTH arsR-type domain-containing protein n=1 Tax=Tuwongella immobilis TaxID=692036 RepID=A0A6C2YT59_9BACT|nr:autorepressor SdpR family transcription factor [Tuwongella immobilis]VIP04900.1 family transcriptional regulator : Regulatory protein, ArsR OS=Fimbriimonas ginsengisoli Gsoil 348 GN=OP10G_0503 PE=4 SV=1: HTH_20 [Tuwongella immobilis]VTS07159.1 family transcriptional regulator : Regulatory protein, ArsR OS=Fimbriimonas ginsengisoli Gsoil 348 GN=OP10G_0503 PE=4 SV=1: HTH_20 [Tuwongella immobilis]